MNKPTLKKYRSKIVSLLALALATPALSYAETLTDFEALEAKVYSHVVGEMPDFSIAREVAKQTPKYPFITPIKEDQVTGITTHKNIVYANESGIPLSLDIAEPTHHGKQQAPAVLLIHGGGWRTGDKSMQLPLAQALAWQGFVGVTVQYRLSRQALYPAGVHDVQAAIRWIKNNAQQYGIDANNIALLGASSGAHMATLIGNVGHLPKFAGKSTIQGKTNSQVQAIINVDGVADLASPQARVFEDKPGKISYAALWLGGRYQQRPELWQEASPLRHAGSHSPATLFINSAQDRFHIGRDEYLAILKQHKIANAVHTLPDTPHAFWLFHPWFDTQVQQITQFLHRVFNTPGSGQLDIALNPSPVDPLRSERINALPKDQQQQWQSYIDKSHALNSQDLSALTDPKTPVQPLQKGTSAWQQVRNYQDQPLTPAQVDNLISWQTPSGGWSKNTDVYSKPHVKGTAYGVENHYSPTFDNGATTTQLRMLAQAFAGDAKKSYAQSLQRGFDLILASQMPNGAFPQTYPLAGGYHNLATFNDGVTTAVVQLLQDAAANPGAFALTNQQTNKVKKAVNKAIDYILSAQQIHDGKRTGWGQQQDPINHTLMPARAFEMPALATMESADILMTLMRHPEPSNATSNTIATAINQGIAWLKRVQIDNTVWQRHQDKNSELIHQQGAHPIWPRFIDQATDEALFGDRNSAIVKDVSQISLERQLGYAWYFNSPQRALDQYQQWRQTHTKANCTLRMAGDSTMQIVDPGKNPDFGWGQVLPHLIPNTTHVFNYAKGGRSTKTFISEGRWQSLLNETHAGDWVLIQFGHNDASYEKQERYTAPVDFKTNLERMVADVKTKQAKALLITPVVRRHFDDEGKLRDMHGIYPSLVREVSQEQNVPLMDLFKISSEYILSLGVKDSIDHFVHIGPGIHNCCAEGRLDNTHFTQKGAKAMAELVIKTVKQQGPKELAECF